MGKTILAFDLYGTLLSTESIADYLSSHLNVKDAGAVAQTWRKEQLQYTWRLNSMKQYQNFEEVTRASFLHALKEHGGHIEDKDVNSVLQAYDDLGTFDDVAPALSKLRGAPGITSVVFSNGTRNMIVNSVNKSGGLSPFADVFPHLISVDHVRSFKPAPETYRYLKNCVTSAELEGDLFLVSSNPFDVAGARSAGLQAVWVDRAGRGWIDKLGYEPTFIVKSLEQLVEAMLTA